MLRMLERLWEGETAPIIGKTHKGTFRGDGWVLIKRKGLRRRLFHIKQAFKS